MRFSKLETARLFRDTWTLTQLSSLLCGWSLLVLHLVFKNEESLTFVKISLRRCTKFSSSIFFWLSSIIKSWFFLSPCSPLSRSRCQLNAPLRNPGIKAKLGRDALPLLGSGCELLIHGYMIAGVWGGV